MSLDELMPSLRDLNRADKFRAMQFLVNELAKEEATLLEAGTEYPVWSPYESYEVADALLKIHRQEKARAFREWAENFPSKNSSPLSDEAIRREYLYAERDNKQP